MKSILRLSRAYFDESWPSREGSGEDFVTLNLEDREGTCCYCDQSAEEAIREAIAPLGAGGTHWIDTGDYHYVSKLFMEMVDEPFFLALFDNHPDDQPGAFESDDSAILSCGSWVLAARRELKFLQGDSWNTSELHTDLPVWLSIDLDVLSRDWARTDWNQGDMTLDELEDAVRRIFAKHRVLGVDVCGGTTVEKGGTAEDFAINSKTRDRLQDLLDQLQQPVR